MAKLQKQDLTLGGGHRRNLSRSPGDTKLHDLPAGRHHSRVKSFHNLWSTAAPDRRRSTKIKFPNDTRSFVMILGGGGSFENCKQRHMQKKLGK